MSAWIDISIPFINGMPPWPGDPPFHRTMMSEIGVDGAQCEVSLLTMSAHAGTHMDAPRHFVPGGGSVDKLDIELLIGDAYLIDLSSGAGHVTVGDLEGRLPSGTIRLLLKTRSSLVDDGVFHSDFRAVSGDAAEYLSQAGVRLLAIDVPSIAPFDAPVGAHRAFLGAPDAAALENVDLTSAGEGWYDLVCLPLKVAGGDGAPARALIRKREARPDAQG